MIEQFHLTHRWDPKSKSIRGQSELRGNGNEGILHSLKSFRPQA